MVVGIIIGVAVIGFFSYCLVYGAAANRSPEYQAWLDEEQLAAIHEQTIDD